MGVYEFNFKYFWVNFIRGNTQRVQITVVLRVVV